MGYFLYLFLIASFPVQADQSYNNQDPNLVQRPDGAMNYDRDDRLNKVDSTAGAIIQQEEPLKLPEATTDHKKEDKKIDKKLKSEDKTAN